MDPDATLSRLQETLRAHLAAAGKPKRHTLQSQLLALADLVENAEAAALRQPPSLLAAARLRTVHLVLEPLADLLGWLERGGFAPRAWGGDVAKEAEPVGLDGHPSRRTSWTTSVPPGTYVCRIGEVRPGTTRSGDPRWAFSLVVDEGEHAGRLAAWDAIIWNDRSLARRQRILDALGEPNPSSASATTGRRALVEIIVAEYANEPTEVITRNEVAPEGYSAAPLRGWGHVETDTPQDDTDTAADWKGGRLEL